MSMLSELGRLLTIAEVAEHCRNDRRTVHRMISRGELVKVKIGRSTRVPEKSLDAFLRRNMVSGGEGR